MRKTGRAVCNEVLCSFRQNYALVELKQATPLFEAGTANHLAHEDASMFIALQYFLIFFIPAKGREILFCSCLSFHLSFCPSVRSDIRQTGFHSV